MMPMIWAKRRSETVFSAKLYGSRSQINRKKLKNKTT